MKMFSGVTILFFCFTGVFAQEEILDEYIRTGLEQNIALQRKQKDWEKSISALQEARALFYPDISVNARYSVADGGRIIEFPVGDLLNPVYATLNELTMSNRFPTIGNEEFPFLRPREHETKLRLVQPLVNTNILFNKRIKERMSKVIRADYESYRRKLVAEIKIAYFEYLKALSMNEIISNTQEILEENVRVNESLFANDKVTRDVVLRSESELSRILAKKTEVDKAVHLSRSYFNFLLNRDLDENVQIMEKPFVEIPLGIDEASAHALGVREELRQISYSEELAMEHLSMQRGSAIPDLMAVVDYGYQGKEYSFSSNDDFIIASLVLKWSIFKGLENRHQIEQARISVEQVRQQSEELQDQIRMEVTRSWHEVVAAGKRIHVARARKESSHQAFRLMDKKYRQGQTNLLEFMDARSEMTNSELELVIALYDYQIVYAEFERSAGLFEFGGSDVEND